MDIYEIARRFSLGLRKVKEMEKAGVLITDPADPILAPILLTLSRSRQLTVEHLAALIDDPSLLDRLGRYEDRARAQLAELGTVKPAPEHVGWAILGAAANDPADVQGIVDWAKEALRDYIVTHHWLAVRLLLSVPAEQRAKEYRRMRRVMLNVRNHPDFAHYWFIEDGETRYRKPLDL